MSYFFADSFDLYNTTADALAGKWDSGVSSNFSLTTGRFGQGLTTSGTGIWVTKSSGNNDAVHHINCAFRQTAALSGSTLGVYLQLLDGSTNQCCIVFRSDGAILLTSGGPTGTTLATYSSAVTVQNVWYAFEFEIVVNNSTGSFTVRAQGAGSTSFTATSLNTRGGTANNYANKLTIGLNANVISQSIDDFIWRSDSSSLAWIGDQRAYVLMPASDSSVQFSRAPGTVTITPVTAGTTSATANGTARYMSFTATYDGTIGTVTISMAAGYTGNMKCSVFSALSSGQPGSVLGSATAIVNPVTGTNTFTFGSPVAVTRNTLYFIGFDTDSASGSYNCSATNVGVSSTTAYASFPVASPTISGVSQAPVFSAIVTPTTNYQMTNEAQQDGTTSYVYDSTVGHADLYAVQALPTSLVAPSSITAVVTRLYVAKSDAGARSAQVQLKSGGTTVQSSTLSLSTSFQWVERVDQVDPNTSSTWSNANVNAVTIGPLVQA